MKTNNLILFFFILLTQSLVAQEGYLRLGGGYSISASNDVFTQQITRRDSNNRYTYDANIYGTIGNGAHLRLSGGYVFSQNFGLDLDVSYLLGAKKQAGENDFHNRKELLYAYTRQLRLSPSFFVRANPGFIQPYAGAGIVLPVLGKTVLEDEITFNDRVIYREREVYGQLSLGFDAYIGVNIRWPNENFTLFVELRYTGLRIKSKNALMKQWTQTELVSGDITDLLATARTFEKEIIFVDEFTLESNTISGTVLNPNFDFDKPLEMLATKTNFNALGLNIGVRMRFGKGDE